MKIFQCREQAFMFNYFRSKDTLIDLKTNVIKLHEAPNSKKREIFFILEKDTKDNNKYTQVGFPRTQIT